MWSSPQAAWAQVESFDLGRVDDRDLEKLPPPLARREIAFTQVYFVPASLYRCSPQRGSKSEFSSYPTVASATQLTGLSRNIKYAMKAADLDYGTSVRRAPALMPGALRRALFLGQELIEISDIEIVDAVKNVGASRWTPRSRMN
jgi:hypothetical protein